jgi:hypothetical protein
MNPRFWMDKEPQPKDMTESVFKNWQSLPQADATAISREQKRAREASEWQHEAKKQARKIKIPDALLSIVMGILLGTLAIGILLSTIYGITKFVKWAWQN